MTIPINRYDRVQSLYDDREWTDDEMESLAAEMIDQLDDPEAIR